MSRIQSRARQSRALNRKSITLILMIAFAVVGILTAVVAFNVVRDFIASQSIFDLPGAPQTSENGPGGGLAGSGLPAATPPTGALQPSIGPTAEPWDGVTRVNILLLGLDYEDTEERRVPRSDTMILLTIDPLSKTAGMMSIPRDMWVNIPGYDYAKINTAYYLGDIYNLPGGGPALAMKTVEEFLGVPINYYAQIDFDAFVKFIDHIKGVKIDIPEDIDVGVAGRAAKVHLSAGRITLDGATALAYARARNTEGGDIDRAGRQQQVILGIRDRILDFNMMPLLVANSPALYRDLSSGIHTNLTLDQVIQLALLSQQIDKSNIRHGVITANMFTFGKSPDGLDILKPIPDQIRLLRDEIFTTGGPVGPAAIASDPVELMKAEAARVSVQNATMTPGLASETANYFKSLGMNVVEETNAELTASSMVIDYTGNPYTVNYLVQTMHIEPARIYNRFDPNAQVDVVVILGNDWANNNTMP